MKNYCINCTKEIDRRSKRCKSCASKGKNNSNYKDGRTINKFYCIDCAAEVKGYKTKRCYSCARKEQYKDSRNHPMFGKNHTQKSKSKMSDTRKILYKNPKNHWNWQGGKSPLRQRLYSASNYSEWRTKVFKRDSYICQECGQHGGSLEAHHKNEFHIIFAEFLKEYDQFSPIEDKETLVRLAMKYKPFWEIDNGKTLCKDCHNLTKGIKVNE